MAGSVQDPRRRQDPDAQRLPCQPGAFVLVDAGSQAGWSRARAVLATALHIVRNPRGSRGFVLIPRRWLVERTFVWLTAYCRLARDYERDPAVSEAMIRWAAISKMVRRITQGRPAVRQQRWSWLKTLD